MIWEYHIKLWNIRQLLSSWYLFDFSLSRVGILRFLKIIIPRKSGYNWNHNSIGDWGSVRSKSNDVHSSAIAHNLQIYPWNRKGEFPNWHTRSDVDYPVNRFPLEFLWNTQNSNKVCSNELTTITLSKSRMTTKLAYKAKQYVLSVFPECTERISGSISHNFVNC